MRFVIGRRVKVSAITFPPVRQYQPNSLSRTRFGLETKLQTFDPPQGMDRESPTGAAARGFR